MLGLGHMGCKITQCLLEEGHHIVAYDSNSDAAKTIARIGGKSVSSIPDLAASLAPPRSIWIMVPSGKSTKSVINLVTNELSTGDVIIDGGKSYKDQDKMNAL